MTRQALAICLTLLAAPAAAAEEAVPVSLAVGQVVTLRFVRPVSQVAVGDPTVVLVKTRGSQVELTGLRSGRTSLLVQLESGDAVDYELRVAAARRAAAPAADPNLVELRVGEQRRLSTAGAVQLMLEENGVARVAAERGGVVVTGVAPGTSSLIVVDGRGTRTVYPIRVR